MTTRSPITPWALVGNQWEQTLRHPHTDVHVRETNDGRGWWRLMEVKGSEYVEVHQAIEPSVDDAKRAATLALMGRQQPAPVAPLHPCPHCGDTAPTIEGDGCGHFWARCHGCGMTGPTEESEDKARAAWDGLPRRVDDKPAPE